FTTYCTSYSEPRGCKTPFASYSHPAGHRRGRKDLSRAAERCSLPEPDVRLHTECRCGWDRLTSTNRSLQLGSVTARYPKLCVSALPSEYPRHLSMGQILPPSSSAGRHQRAGPVRCIGHPELCGSFGEIDYRR